MPFWTSHGPAVGVRVTATVQPASIAGRISRGNSCSRPPAPEPTTPSTGFPTRLPHRPATLGEPEQRRGLAAAGGRGTPVHRPHNLPDHRTVPHDARCLLLGREQEL